MQQVETEVGPFTRRSRSLHVRGDARGLTRPLVAGEHLLVHDPVSDEHFTALVADAAPAGSPEGYRLVLGTRITAAEAQEWLAPWPLARHTTHLTTRDIVALLAELRHTQSRMSQARDEALAQ
ncbi:hypothetical protein JK386_16340 [Nocardioides sp. zg-536]|uniref:Uncharacterized protein n=1 Tax=Nocardioides faecalis TaxID=2803858 RepID=A0A938Y944_9ACTN|nr:hypothetical protein [Nocardioides faecalis]MBM9461474.1 hypothetical protein [Nocardioides faecalis]QVI59339.1 hypothetical protein KG111_02920 [Nocardioides faecalis]